MSSPAVSVVIPVYNTERYVSEAIRSVLAQTHQDFEIIVVDDGSTDHSRERCARFTDPRIRLVSQKNRGLAGARNRGISESRAPIIAFLDSDDVWEKDKLRRHLSHLERAPEVGVSYSCSSYIDEAGRPLGFYQVPRLRHITPDYQFYYNPVGNGSAVVIRRQTLEDVRGPEKEGHPTYFDEAFRQAEDYELWMRIILTTSWAIEGIPYPLTRYRINPAGLTAQRERQRSFHELANQKVKERVPELYEQWKSRRRAYFELYMARNCLLDRAPKEALRCLKDAFIADRRAFGAPQVFLAVAATAQTLLPPKAYDAFETRAFHMLGRLQRRTMNQLARRYGDA